jgi:hypothetical protein
MWRQQQRRDWLERQPPEEQALLRAFLQRLLRLVSEELSSVRPWIPPLNRPEERSQDGHLSKQLRPVMHAPRVQ